MDITDDILVSYLLKELPAEQHSAVQAWIAASRENRSHFDELRLIWKESGRLEVHSTVDTDQAWNRFRKAVNSQKPVTRPFPVLRLARIAAALLLLAGGIYTGGVAMHQRTADTAPAVVRATPVPLPAPAIAATKVVVQEEPVAAQPEQAQKAPVKMAAVTPSVKPAPARTGEHTAISANNHRTQEFVCNATPCPLEICIVQTVRCDNGTTKKVATCNVLQPDQAGQLHYKAFDRGAGNCNATVAEIRIKRLSTGETIVLNKETQPTTVEEIFNYLTGVKKEQVDILAGVFETDCDNSCNQHKLKIGSDFSHLILQ
jgi:hypothetical protein